MGANFCEKNIFSDIVLLFAMFFSFVLDESKFSFFLFSFLLFFYLWLRFKPTLLSPYFYLFPSSIYLAINLIFVYQEQVQGCNLFFLSVFVGLFFFSISLRYTYSIVEDDYRFNLVDISFFVKLFFLSLFFLSFLKFLLLFDIFSSALKALYLSSNFVFSAIIFSSLISIATRRIYLSLLLSLFYFAFVFASNMNSADFSRLSMIDYFFLVFFCVYFFHQGSSSRLFVGHYLISFFVIILFFSQAISVYLSDDVIRFGGDAFIVNNAIDVINASKGKSEPLMPFFNGLLIMFPDGVYEFLFGMKPKNYNSSAWFIENIFNIDAGEYPWGIGISLFGSGYLYGGLVGVISIFSLIGTFIGKLSKLVVNPFWAGFFCYTLMRLPLAVYRMDETFLFGSFIPMLVFLYGFFYFFGKRINGYFC